jgi:hypothetical protein
VTLISYEAMSRFLAKAARQSNSNHGEQTEPRSIPPTAAMGNVHRLVQPHSSETELMRKIAPTFLHDLLRTISELEEMVRAAGNSA